MSKSILIGIVSGTAIYGKDKDKKTTTKLKYELNKILEFPLTEDLQIEAISDFTTFAGIIPQLDKIVSLMTLFSSAGGYAGQDTIDFTNMFDVPRWERTNPIRINLNLLLYTKDDPKTDVYNPMMEIVGLTILSPDEKNKSRYRLPGLNLNNMYMTKGSTKSLDTISKLVSIRIPGIIYLPIAFIKKAVPTISKEETQGGYPLWATLNIEIEGVRPANTTELLLESNIHDLGGGILGRNKSEVEILRGLHLTKGL